MNMPLDQAKAVFSSASASDRSFWRDELLRHKHFDSGYFGIELSVDFDMPEDVGLRGILYNLPLRKLRRITIGAKRCEACGDLYLSAVDPMCDLRVWRNRLFTFAHEDRTDGRDLDAILAVYATLFAQSVTKLTIEVTRPMRGHFEDHPVSYEDAKAKAYFSRFAI